MAEGQIKTGRFFGIESLAHKQLDAKSNMSYSLLVFGGDVH